MTKIDVNKNRIKFYTEDEQRVLFDRARRGDRAAIEEISISYFPLVNRLAWKFANRENLFDDLVQEGRVGLLRSIEKYDPSMNTKFITYAYYCISRQIMNSKIAEDKRRARESYFVTRNPYSCNTEERDICDEIIDEEEKLTLKASVKKLRPLCRDIIIRRFGLNGFRERTLEQVGEKYGLTKERIRQIQEKALRELRLLMSDSVLES
ncbi:MAG: sigma-70 family RNA polymerase sigma factor [Nanoarchaeota archaeon]